MMKCIILLSVLLILSNVLNGAEGKICVATEENRYLCTDDIMKANASRMKGENFDFESELGVKQTIAGTKEEMDKVTAVMDKMKDYFLTEVFAKPEYRSVRDKCKNKEKLCAFWASVGECESNRPFMISSCSAACRFCLQIL